jgi:hypothetical protein
VLPDGVLVLQVLKLLLFYPPVLSVNRFKVLFRFAWCAIFNHSEADLHMHGEKIRQTVVSENRKISFDFT